MFFCGATDTPVLDFWWRLLWVSNPKWMKPRRLNCTENISTLLLLFTFQGSGHMVPQDKPIQAYEMFKKFITNQPFWKNLNESISGHNFLFLQK